jgi:hypothetical protein
MQLHVTNAGIRVKGDRWGGGSFALPDLPALLFVVAMLFDYSMV